MPCVEVSGVTAFLALGRELTCKKKGKKKPATVAQGGYTKIGVIGVILDRP